MDKESHINWKQFYSLLALYASVLIGWIAYYNYQPKLLIQFNFTELKFFLYVAQGIILVITPPIAGYIGDHYRRKSGNRLPVIMAGVSLAAMIFMSLAFTLISNPDRSFFWILPVLIIIWLFSMSIFTSPALSTIELFIPQDKIVKGMAIVTIVYGLIYALEPVIVDLVDFIGAPLTFVTGGVLVASSGYWLKRTSGEFFDHQKEPKSSLGDFKNKYFEIFGLGIVFGSLITFLFNLYPSQAKRHLEDSLSFIGDGGIVLSILLVIAALISIPLSKPIVNLGMGKSFRRSLIIALIASSSVFMDFQILFILGSLGLAFAFSTLSITSLPLALERTSFQQKVLGVGVFFSGVELPNSILEAYLVSVGII